MGEESPFPTQFPDKKFIVKHPLCEFGNIWSLNGWCFCGFFPLEDISYITAASLYQLRSAMVSSKKHLIQPVFPQSCFSFCSPWGFCCFSIADLSVKMLFFRWNFSFSWRSTFNVADAPLKECCAEREQFSIPWASPSIWSSKAGKKGLISRLLAIFISIK